MRADHESVRERSVSAGGHARWVGEQLADGRLVELGEAERAGRTWRVRGGWRRRRVLLAACVLVAIGCAGVGIVLLTAPTQVTVSMSASIYRIGDAALHDVAPGVYAGDGALVVRVDGQRVRAGGSAMVDGKRWVGVCEVSADGSREACRLQRGATAVTTADLWADGGWMRTYSDGQRTLIEAPRGVPVPFPAGR